MHLLPLLPVRPMEQDASSAKSDELPGSGGSTAAPDETREIKTKHELVPQLRFPPGYHFVPTEEELIDVYLRAKIDGRRLPLDVFTDVNILDWEPGKLVEEYKGYGEKRWFFFTKREKSPSNKEKEPRRKLRVAGVTASWKATGSVPNIFRSGTEEVIGTKRILTYHSSIAAEDGKWTMHEFVMADKPGMDQWVLCTIQLTLHWKANGGSGKKRKKGKRDDTSMEPKITTKRRKKMTTSQAQEAQQQQQQQETTPNGGSAGTSPLLMHEQAHQAFHEEHPMALDEKGLMIPVVVAPQGYPDGDHHYLDVSMQQEIASDGSGEPPLMMMHQQGYQTSHEEQYPLTFTTDMPQGYPNGVHHHQLDTSMAPQMYAEHAGFMPHYQWSAMDVPFHTVHDHSLLHSQWQQQQLGYMGQLVSPITSWDRAQYQFHQQDIEGLIGTQGFHGDVTGNSQETVQFPHGLGKIPLLQTSPDSVLGVLEPRPYLGSPVENAHLYSNNSYDMMLSGTSAMAQGTSYGSGADQFSSVEQVFAGDSNGGDDLELFINGFLNHNSDDNLIGNGDGGNAGSEGSNQGSHKCSHGLQWRCGEQQSVDMVRCFLCAPSCGTCSAGDEF